jgi:hypothetical protein
MQQILRIQQFGSTVYLHKKGNLLMLREVGYAFVKVDYQVNTASPATRIRIGYDAQGEGNSTIDYF